MAVGTTVVAFVVVCCDVAVESSLTMHGFLLLLSFLFSCLLLRSFLVCSFLWRRFVSSVLLFLLLCFSCFLLGLSSAFVVNVSCFVACP